jgi:Rab-GTPase-TBC domain
MYATQWFLTTYLYNLSFSVVLRIWDVFSVEGFSFLYCVALGLFRLYSEKLLKMEFEDLFNTLQFNSKEAGLEVDAVQLIAAACSFRDKVKKHIPKLEAKFAQQDPSQG